MHSRPSDINKHREPLSERSLLVEEAPETYKRTDQLEGHHFPVVDQLPANDTNR